MEFGNNSGSAKAKGGGIGFCGLLTIVFIVLKLLKVINWKWVWVFSPIWIPAAIVLIVALILIIVSLVVAKKQ